MVGLSQRKPGGYRLTEHLCRKKISGAKKLFHIKKMSTPKSNNWQ